MSGRRMDDAWKKAISEGLKRARRGAGKGIENSGKVIGSRASQKAASIATGTARGFIAGSVIGSLGMAYKLRKGQALVRYTPKGVKELNRAKSVKNFNKALQRELSRPATQAAQAKAEAAVKNATRFLKRSQKVGKIAGFVLGAARPVEASFGSAIVRGVGSSMQRTGKRLQK